MLKWPRFEVLSISKRDFALVFTLLFNAFTWSYMIFTVIDLIALQSLVGSAFSTIFNIVAAGSGFSGALFCEKIRRRRFLYLWMILGLVSSSLLTLFYNTPAGYLSIIFILLGISFGLGMPSSLAYLADHTSVEHRGIISSLIFLAANLSALPLAVLFMKLNPIMTSLILVAWRGLGLLVFFILKPKEEDSRGEKRGSFFSVLQYRPFALYLVPWTMFLLVDAFEKALLENYIGLDFLRSILLIEPMISVFFSLVAGLLIDRIGRKRMVLYGFVTLGIGYAIVGLAPTIKASWYFYTFVDGAAWGILLTIFLLTLWGDLSQPGTREKFYAIGSFPFLVRSIIPLALMTIITSVPANAAFSLASFFLFVAILPLMYAPETLPEKKIELRRVKGYVEQAKKLRDKYFEKRDAKED